MKTKTINVRLNTFDAETLERICRKHQVSESDAIRKGIELLKEWDEVKTKKEIGKMRKLLDLNGKTREVNKGKYGLFYLEDGSDYEIYFDENGEFAGILIDNLDKTRLEGLENDFENGTGFFDSCFEAGEIEEYSNIFDIE